jgi:hypothetical protein
MTPWADTSGTSTVYWPSVTAAAEGTSGGTVWFSVSNHETADDREARLLREEFQRAAEEASRLARLASLRASAPAPYPRPVCRRPPRADQRWASTLRRFA